MHDGLINMVYGHPYMDKYIRYEIFEAFFKWWSRLSTNIILLMFSCDPERKRDTGPNKLLLLIFHMLIFGAFMEHYTKWQIVRICHSVNNMHFKYIYGARK